MTTKQRPGGKTSTSFWVSTEAMELLNKLAEKWGIPKSSVLEMIIRERAKKELKL